uniref:Uncharacterized protein n=1 Tax=Oryza meridionalis TaxID=40149 RepID=A0A0E0C9M2_9ORYZ
MVCSDCPTVAPPPTSSAVELGHRGAADGYRIQQHSGRRRIEVASNGGDNAHKGSGEHENQRCGES